MVHVKRSFILFAIMSMFLMSCRTGEKIEQAKVNPEISKNFKAGEPIATTRKTALSDWTIQGEVSAEQIRKCFEINSDATMKQYSLFLSPFTDNEKKFMEHLKNSPPPIVSRTSFARLRGIMKQKALLSPREAVRRGIIAERAVTPGSEDILLGAFDCVFATVGTWDGTPRYGDVIIRLKDSSKEIGWATPWSGFSFLKWIRKKDHKRMDFAVAHNQDPGINNDDRLLYLMFIIAGKDWNAALGYEAIIFLRAQDQMTQADKNAVIEKALQLKDPREFWNFFVGKHHGKGPMGYMEAKFPAFVPSEYFESIEVPENKLAEVMSWLEAEPFMNIIKIKDKD